MRKTGYERRMGEGKEENTKRRKEGQREKEIQDGKK